jgi:hypothetical protein
MPNWCDNNIRLYHEDKTKIDALEAEMSKKSEDGNFLAEPFQHLRPNPSGEWQYDWSVENWGTKWEASIIDWSRDSDNELSIYCDTAWSPPTALYQYLTEQGWQVEAYYHEGGMGYAGKYTSEDGDDYYEYDVTDQNTIDEIPSDIVEFAGLENAHQEWMENEEEDRIRQLPKTDWFDGKVKPDYVGRYEIQTKGHEWDHYAEWNGTDWGKTWDGKKIKPTKWRGLVNEFTAADAQAMLDDIIESS